MGRFTKMVDMARTPAEVKDEIAETCAPCAPSDAKRTAPVYPYGLCVSLDEEVLGKLGIKELPDVGETVHFAALARVTSASESEHETEGGEKQKRCRVELQITNLALESEDDESGRRDRFYGKSGD